MANEDIAIINIILFSCYMVDSAAFSLSLKVIEEAAINSDASRIFLYLLLVVAWAHIVTSLVYYRRMMDVNFGSGNENSPSESS